MENIAKFFSGGQNPMWSYWFFMPPPLGEWIGGIMFLQCQYVALRWCVPMDMYLRGVFVVYVPKDTDQVWTWDYRRLIFQGCASARTLKAQLNRGWYFSKLTEYKHYTQHDDDWHGWTMGWKLGVKIKRVQNCKANSMWYKGWKAKKGIIFTFSIKKVPG